MGLDSYFMLERGKPNDESKLPSLPDTFNGLCGGMFSGYGNDGSFRGKVYNSFVVEVTGVSLYSEWIPNDVVRVMADKLEDYTNEHYIPDPSYVDLAMVFRAFADAGYGLYGWW